MMSEPINATVGHLLRELAPQVLRAHLFERAGDHERALAHYRVAAERTTSIPERNYLTTKATRLAADRRAAEKDGGAR